MYCVVLLLSAVIGKSDPRWKAFGLNVPKPGAPARMRRDETGGEVVHLHQVTTGRLSAVA
jgi:hypothetical protein